MNREIKFKAKSVKNGEWIESMTVSKGMIKRKRNNLFMEISEGKWIGIVPESLSQYTGLKDKNGVEIYEGDVILYQNSVEEGEGTITFERGFCITWNSNTVKSTSPVMISPLYYFGCSDEIIIIGNIYNNC